MRDKKAYMKAYRLANKKKIAAQRKAYYTANKTKEDSMAKEWTKLNRLKRIEYSKKQNLINPEGYQARHAVRYQAKKDPSFKKPCLVCGDPKSHGHHHLGYAKAHWLHVQWFCAKHHSQIHKNEEYYGN